MRRLALFFSAGLLVVTASPAAAVTIDWSECPDSPKYDCATVRVPKDWDHPRKQGDYRLDVRRLPALGNARKPTLFINPGGPGSSGVDQVENFETDERLRRHYNIVGFDPRGVGGSTPLPKGCARPATVSPQPQTGPFGWQPVVQQFAGAAAEVQGPCWDKNKASRPWMGTRYVLQDLDALRAGVGDRKLSYYGVSYGTTLGRSYAHRYPKRVRVMVLDGVTDPSSNLFDKMRVHVTGAKSTWHMMHDGMPVPVQDLYARVNGLLATQLIPDPLGEPLDRWTFWKQGLLLKDSAGLAGYTCQVAEQAGLPTPQECATAGTAELRAGGGSPAAAVVPIVDCLDWTGRPEPADIARTIESGSVGPEAAGNVIQYATLCSGVPASKRPLPPVKHLKTSSPVLLVNGMWDLRTPLRGAELTRKALVGSRLVSVKTKVHGVFNSPAVDSPCTDRIVRRYLISRKLPARDRTCGVQ